MITLEQLVNEQKWNEMTDIQIIKEFFTLNDMEEDGIEMISELTKAKITKLKKKHHIIEEWTCMLPSKYLYENYNLDVADKLHNLELDFLVNGCELSNDFLHWAEKNVPNIIKPEAYFNPLIDYLQKKGIHFKER